VRTCRQGIVDYFSQFLRLKPFGTIDKCIIRELAPDVAINSGIYTFKLTRDAGESGAEQTRSWPQAVPLLYRKHTLHSARCTYTRVVGVILQHHSCTCPDVAQDKVSSPYWSSWCI
jgi:hypothetical protein